jgi:RNA polymerase sigma factor (sigma-70 family)
MTTGARLAVRQLEACDEVAGLLTSSLASALRWLAAHPGSGGMVVIEGFVRGNELLLVADMPDEAGLGRSNGSRMDEGRAGSPPQGRAFSASLSDGLWSFAVQLTPEGRPPPLMSLGGATADTDVCAPTESSAPTDSPESASSGAANSPWPSDEDLVRQILSGSQAAFDVVYEAYLPRIYRYALRRLGDVAETEDVTREVFVTVLRALASYEGNESLPTWIFTITRDEVNRRLRRLRPGLDAPDGDIASVAGQRGNAGWTEAGTADGLSPGAGAGLAQEHEQDESRIDPEGEFRARSR